MPGSQSKNSAATFSRFLLAVSGTFQNYANDLSKSLLGLATLLSMGGILPALGQKNAGAEKISALLNPNTNALMRREEFSDNVIAFSSASPKSSQADFLSVLATHKGIPEPSTDSLQAPHPFTHRYQKLTGKRAVLTQDSSNNPEPLLVYRVDNSSIPGHKIAPIQVLWPNNGQRTLLWRNLGYALTNPGDVYTINLDAEGDILNAELKLNNFTQASSAYGVIKGGVFCARWSEPTALSIMGRCVDQTGQQLNTTEYPIITTPASYRVHSEVVLSDGSSLMLYRSLNTSSTLIQKLSPQDVPLGLPDQFPWNGDPAGIEADPNTSAVSRPSGGAIFCNPENNGIYLKFYNATGGLEKNCFAIASGADSFGSCDLAIEANGNIGLMWHETTSWIAYYGQYDNNCALLKLTVPLIYSSERAYNPKIGLLSNSSDGNYAHMVWQGGTQLSGYSANLLLANNGDELDPAIFVSRSFFDTYSPIGNGVITYSNAGISATAFADKIVVTWNGVEPGLNITNGIYSNIIPVDPMPVLHSFYISNTAELIDCVAGNPCALNKMQIILLRAPVPVGYYIATMTLIPPSLGSLTVGTTGSGGFSNYSTTAGLWYGAGNIQDVNTLFPTLVPYTKYPSQFEIGLWVIDSHGVEYNNTISGQFHPGGWAPDLGTVDIAVPQGGEVLLDANLLPITLYNNESASAVQLTLNALQNCEVVLTSNASTVTAPVQFSLADLQMGKYSLANQGSGELMSFVWSAQSGSAQSANQTVKVTLNPWPVKALSNLDLANGELVVLSNANILFLNPRDPSNAQSVQLGRGVLNNCWLEWVSSGQSINDFEVLNQENITQGQVAVRHAGNNQIPAISLIPEIGYGNQIAVAPAVALNITFIPDQGAEIIRNTLIVTNEKTILDTNTLDVLNLNRGGLPDNVLLVFEEVSGQMQNSSTGERIGNATRATVAAQEVTYYLPGGIKPAYKVKACTQFVCSESQAANITDNRFNLGAVVGGSIAGVGIAGSLLTLGLIAGMRAAARKKLLKHLRESTRSTGVWKLAADLYEALNLNYRGVDSTEVSEYLSTVAVLCSQLEAGKTNTIEVEQITQGNGREELAALIARVLKGSDGVYIKTSACGLGNQLSLTLINTDVADIANKVKTLYFSKNQQDEIELPEINVL